MDTIVAEEERVLTRIVKHLSTVRERREVVTYDYDAELISLRDQIAEARLEDVPPLIEEMERLQGVAARRASVVTGGVDAQAPYFGRLVLQEGQRKREVLIGRGTYLDPRTGVRIVDWRDAPVSRLYYRYEEGDDYEENFGGRDVYGEILVRRSVAIVDGVLRRIGTPQGSFIRGGDDRWRRAADSAVRLQGGQGAAMRPEAHHKPGKLGIGRDGDGRADRFLPEITALIDPRQFDLITKPDSGLVVIQGGAGSGKTTIGLHRMAYLAFQDAKKFRPEKMLVVVFNDALARYISKVLPALGVPGVPVTTYEAWAKKQRIAHVPGLAPRYTDSTPSTVVRMKKHPAMLQLIEQWAGKLEASIEAALHDAIDALPGKDAVLAAFEASKGSRPLGRAMALERWALEATKNEKVSLALRHAVERVAQRARREARDVAGAWHDLLTDRQAIRQGFDRWGPGVLDDKDLDEALKWCAARCALAIAEMEARAVRRDEGRDGRGGDGASKEKEKDDVSAAADRILDAEELDLGAALREHERERARVRDGEEWDAISPPEGIDGEAEIEKAELDREDDTLLLRIVQRLRGPLTKGREPLVYQHVLVDEAQDLSPVELAVVLSTTTPQRSVTLAGDTAQRLLMDNGFTDWNQVLGNLGFDSVAIEPLRVTYRSTAEIVDFARQVLGPLAPEEPPLAPRHGVPVDLFRFTQAGEAVAFLGEALRELAGAEPRASIAVISRYPEQADLYFRGLQNAEVPNLRRIAEQDFPFKAGIDVTDVRQVKGLEFDYVVLLEVGAAVYPTDDEARHLLHIAATRAAHQLWVTTTTEPSVILPDDLRRRGY
jgi:DNA helicase-2/ATP-dependent DNA helicase PcrA